LWQKLSFSYLQSFLSRRVNCAAAGLNEGKKLSGEALSPGFRLEFVEIVKEMPPAWQEQNHSPKLRGSPHIRDTMGLLVAAIHFNRLGGSVNRHFVVEPALRSRFRFFKPAELQTCCGVLDRAFYV
jgi:hypothetical protein